jgi:probable F420-dependent oxidoreductase
MSDRGSVRFSLTIPRIVRRGETQPYKETFRIARHADELGFHAGYFGHHSFTPETRDPSAPFVVLGAIAAQTERLRLGTSIYLAALHHPVTTGEMVQQLDQLSGGRAICGVGVGYRPYEFEGLGREYADRGARLTESIEIWKKAWETGFYDHDGPHYRIPRLPVEPPVVQRPRPPIIVGGTSSGSIRRAARHGDGWFTLPMENLTKVKELVDRYRAEVAAVGGTPYVALLREAWVAESDALVEQQWLDRALEFHRYYWEAGTKGDEDDPILQRVAAGERVPYREFANERAIVGTPELCVEQLHRWHDAIDFDEVLLMLGGPREIDPFCRAMSIFATEVVPAFRA